MSHRPPKNDRERLENLFEALAEPGDGDDAFDELMHADLARRGLTLESWAAQLQEKAHAVIAQNRRARRMRTLKIAGGVLVGLAAASAGVALVVRAAMQHPLGDAASMSMSMKTQLPSIAPDAGVAVSPPK